MDEIQQQIDQTVKDNEIVIFMKGSPEYPQCGFSATASQILVGLERPFAYVDVFEIPEARQGVKDYTQWPTIPQIFVKGEFIGGCDILQQMAASGELRGLFEEKAPAAE